MSLSRLLAIQGALVLGLGLVSLTGCASRTYVREAKDCACAKMMGKCQCNHCMGEAGAKCYCGSGGCGCGATMPKCQCGHCTGLAGETDCPCAKEHGHSHG